jgi:hypothetical protein
LFVFPCNVSSWFLFPFSILFSVTSQIIYVNTTSVLCWPYSSVEFDIILFDQWHFFHQFRLSSLDSYTKI